MNPRESEEGMVNSTAGGILQGNQEPHAPHLSDLMDSESQIRKEKCAKLEDLRSQFYARMHNDEVFYRKMKGEEQEFYNLISSEFKDDKYKYFSYLNHIDPSSQNFFPYIDFPKGYSFEEFYERYLSMSADDPFFNSNTSFVHSAWAERIGLTDDRYPHFQQDSHMHTPLYHGEGRGDTWTLPEHIDENPRLAAVAFTREKFSGPISVLDIGCGKGLNTKWIAELDAQSQWTGIDVVSPDATGLELPNEPERFHFFQGDILDPAFRDKFVHTVGTYEIIVDQGAVLAEISDDDLRSTYLQFINEQLSDDGRFVVLVMEGDGATIVFPDGRNRRTYKKEEFGSPVFQDKFELEESELCAYSYLPENPQSPIIKNPLGSKTGDAQQLTVSHFVLKKRKA